MVRRSKRLSPAERRRRADQRAESAKRLHDEFEAAAHLGVSERTMQGWRSRGGGPVFVKLGKRILYRIEDLDAFVASRRFVSTRERAEAVA